MFEFQNKYIYITTNSILLVPSIFPNNEWQIAEVNSEFCQTYKMECSMNKNYFYKELNLRCLILF